MTTLLLHFSKYKVIIINQNQTLNGILKYTVHSKSNLSVVTRKPVFRVNCQPFGFRHAIFIRLETSDDGDREII